MEQDARTHTHTHTNQTQAVTQSCTQNASSQADGDSKWPTVGRVCVCVCVWEQSRVFCVDWEVGSVPVTDPYRRQIKTALFSWGERQIEGTEALRLHHNSPMPPSWTSTGELAALRLAWCCIHTTSAEWKTGKSLHFLTLENSPQLGHCLP